MEHVSAWTAFKTGLCLAMPFNGHGFKAFLKTLLFYGGGFFLLFGGLFPFLPRAQDGSFLQTLEVFHHPIAFLNLAMLLVLVFPFIVFYPARCVLEGHRNHAYFKDVGTPLFMRALLVSCAMCLIMMVPSLLSQEASVFIVVPLTIFTYFFTLYGGMALVHLVVTGCLDFKEAFLVFRATFFRSLFAAFGALLVVFLFVILCFVILSFVGLFVGGAIFGPDASMVGHSLMTYALSIPVQPDMLPYRWIYGLGMGLFMGLMAWSHIGFYGALSVLYRGQTQRS